MESTVEILGVAYTVLKAFTPEMTEEWGNSAIADRMRKHRVSHWVYMVRAKRGKVIHMVCRWENGEFGTVTRIPGTNANNFFAEGA